MTWKQGPAITRRRLRLTLRRLREQNRYTLEQVRKSMDWSISKLVRIESGAVSITTNDLRVLLGHYGVRDDATIQSLVELAKLSRRHHWASEYRDLFTSSYMDFLAYEDEVVQARHFHPLFVPGLLQTAGYARAIVMATAVGRLSSDEIDARVRLRMERQERILDSECRRKIQVAIDQSVLDRRIGDEEIMAEQLAHLERQFDGTRVEVIIVPPTVDAHLGLTGPFSLLEFDSDEDQDIVYLDNAPSDVALIEDVQAVRRYRETFERLYRDGIRGGGARELIASIRRELSQPDSIDVSGKRPAAAHGTDE